MNAGVCLQAWGARTPTSDNAEKIFQYLKENKLYRHLLQHVARGGWDFTHLKF